MAAENDNACVDPEIGMKTVLVVDDMAVFREPIAVCLRTNGYTAICACNGAEALKVLESTTPDLILLDIDMPVMDGLAFLEAMPRNTRGETPPVILLTVSAKKDHIIRASNLGVRDYLLKSQFSLSELLARVAARVGVSKTAETAPPTTPPVIASKSIASIAPPIPALKPSTKTAIPHAAPSPSSDVESLKSLKPLVTRAAIEAHIEKSGDIKAMSPTVSQLLQITSSTSCSIDQLVKTIRQDQAIALKILKLANSAIYTRGEPVQSVHKAVTRIGMAQIRQVVLNISVVDAFAHNDLSEHLTSSQFWEHSIACGLIAAEIVHNRGGKPNDADTAFTMGLLHDVGQMVYAEALGSLYRDVLVTAERLQLPLEQVESRMLMVNHADIMERVLVAWRFPKYLITPIALHHLSIGNIRQMAPNMVEPIATLVLANCLAHALLLGASGNLSVYSTTELVRGLKLTPAVIRQIVEKIPGQTQDIKLTMLSNTNDKGWGPMAQTVRKQIGAPLRPVFISEDLEIDANAIFVDTVRDPDRSQPPNLGVVHIANVRERIAVTAKLKAAEAEAKVSGLPLILISPTGSLALEEGTMAGRRTEMLRSPFVISRFTAAAKILLAA